MDLALNATTYDLDMLNGDLYVVRDQDCVVQFLKQRLKMFLGEWFVDESAGVPYFDEIFVKNPNPVVIDSRIKLVIIQTPGVVEILSFSMSLDGPSRSLSIAFTARSQTGIIDFSQTIKVG